MNEVNNPKFNASVKRNLNSLEKLQKKDFEEICKIFPKSYVLGGFVRDSILQVLYNYDFPLNDLDMLVDDKEFGYKVSRSNLSDKNTSRFGGLKLKYDNTNFEIDLFDIKNIFFLNKNPLNKKSLENVLKGVDLSTSALAYDINNDCIYQCGAMKDIKNKEINTMKDNGLIAPTIARLIIHSDKLGFEIGKKGLDYLKKNYKSELDDEIKEFLNYKKISHLFPLIKNKLEVVLNLRLHLQDNYQ